ncbi:GNAT family N-acetyltransferase [Paenibacillaceae bacterium WGS1546]|uniref:GNAT family N-acetyltransferase n=1 Tax=Cohnella sp. WGS1546 TaxID=3366810 RepID=UPI00372CED87
MPDMLVKLYELPDKQPFIEKTESHGVRIKRALSADKSRIVDFVRKHFTENWANECECAFAQLPSNAFIAVKDKEVVGFACYDAVVRDFFGPTGVREDCRGQGIGAALLVTTLHAMKEAGYGYAIIGWVSEALGFYERTVGAIAIENSFPGVYRDLAIME